MRAGARGRGGGADASSASGSARRARSSASTARAPVGVDPTAPGDDARNVIVWLDHRATARPRASAAGHARLRTVGGAVSPEMEIPKLLWLRSCPPRGRAHRTDGKALDLADFLVHRASDRARDVRSCARSCASGTTTRRRRRRRARLGRDFLRGCGFADGELGPHTVGADVRAPGARVDGGVGPEAARARARARHAARGRHDRRARGRRRRARRGRAAGAAAGRAGAAAAARRWGARAEAEALLSGTSACHMASSAAPCSLACGGRTTAPCSGPVPQRGRAVGRGQAVDHLIDTHPARARSGRPRRRASAAPRRSTRGSRLARAPGR